LYLTPHKANACTYTAKVISDDNTLSMSMYVNDGELIYVDGSENDPTYGIYVTVLN